MLTWLIHKKLRAFGQRVVVDGAPVGVLRGAA